MQNTVAKKRAAREGVDSDYLFVDLLTPKEKSPKFKLAWTKDYPS